MPAIYLFGRRTHLAGDDLQVPAVLTIWLRLLQTFVLVAPLLYQVVNDVRASADSWFEFLFLDPSENGPCHRSHWFALLTTSWLCGCILFGTLSVIGEYRIYHWSGFGSPTISGVELRSAHVQKLLQAKLVYGTIAVALLAASSVAALFYAPAFLQCHAVGDESVRTSTVSDDIWMVDDDYDTSRDYTGSQLSQATIGLHEDEIVASGLNDDFNDDFAIHTKMNLATGMESTLQDTDSSSMLSLQSIPKLVYSLRQSTSYSRIGSHWWWIAYSLLLLSQIAEVLLSIVASSLLYVRHPSSSVDRDSSMQNNASIMTSPSSEIHFYRRRTIADEEESRINDIAEAMWESRCHQFFRCLAYSTCFLFGGNDLIGASDEDTDSRNNSNDGSHQIDGSARGRGAGAVANNSSTYANNPYKQVARLFADYWKAGDGLDVTPTDIVAGMMVLQRVQRLSRLKARLDVLQQRTSSQRMTVPQHPELTMTRAQSYPVTETNRSLLQTSSPGSSVSAPNSIGSNYAARTVITGSVPPHVSMVAMPGSSETSTVVAPSSASASSLLVRRGNSSVLRARTPPSTAAANNSTIPPLSIDKGTAINRASGTAGPINAATPITGSLYQSINSSSRQSIYRRVSSQDSLVTGGSTSSTSNGHDGRTEAGRTAHTAASALGSSLTTPYRRVSRKILSPSTNATDFSVLHEGARYARHALSIYTWKLYLYDHPIVGPFRLLKSCTMCKRSNPPALYLRQRQPRRPPIRPMSPTHFDVSTKPSESVTQPDTQTLLHHDHGLLPCTVGDNLCQFHKKALLLTADLDESDLVYAHFVNSYLNMPYCIVLDHAMESVVLSIRGTLSLEDIVTDIMCDAMPLDPVEFNYVNELNANPDWPRQYGFSGAVACVMNIWDDLQRHKWLERLLLGTNALYPSYSLRITGHSLGGAAASLLGFKLRKDHPTLQVYSYCPPGCILTWELAKLSQQWTTSFVLDSDLVPRLTPASVENLRDSVLQLFGRIKVPKFRVAEAFLDTSGRGCTGMFTTASAQATPCSCSGNSPTVCCCFGSDGPDSASVDDDRSMNNSGTRDDDNDIDRVRASAESLSNILDKLLADEIPESTPYRRQLDRFLSMQSELRSTRGPERSALMYPPGRIVHLVKTDVKEGCCESLKECVTCCMTNAGSKYTPVWINNDDLNEIVVSPTMVTDHFVGRLCIELEKLAEDTNVTMSATATTTATGSSRGIGSDSDGDGSPV